MTGNLHAACYDRVQLDIRTGEGGVEVCDIHKTLSDISFTPIPVGFSPDATHCDGGTWTDAGGCVNVMTFCCDDAIENYEHDNHEIIVVAGVPFGQEKDAAKLAFDAFVASPSTACASGFTQAGFMAGYAFDSELSSSGNLVDLYLSSWKQTLCSKSGSGNIIPVSQLPGGSGSGGGLTQAETAAAVTTGVSALDTQMQTLNSKIDSTNQLLTSIDSKTSSGGSGVDYGLMSGSITSGVNSSVLSSKLDQIITNTASGSGLTQPEATQAVKDGLDSAVGITSDSLGMSPYTKPGAYTNPEFSSFGSFDFGSRINTFVAEVKTTPLVSNFTLTGLADVPVSGVSTLPLSLGTFGNVNFDFSTYAGTYNYIKGFLLLLSSYLAVRIIILKR